jgi:hypothetical protein
MSKCANPKCEAEAKPGQLACREHWFQLPKPLMGRRMIPAEHFSKQEAPK